MSFELLSDILATNIIQHGEFTLKSGRKDSVYLDFRKLPSIPKLFNRVIPEMIELINDTNDGDLECDSVCGVPYGAIPLATAIANAISTPLVMCRKEGKGYGNDQMVSCDKQFGSVIIIEDVITTGSSVIETINKLLEYTDGHLEILGVYCLVDRRDDPSMLLDGEYPVHSLFPFRYIKYAINPNAPKRHWSINKMLYYAEVKKTNVIASLDLTNFDKIVEIAINISPFICGIKIHEDIIRAKDEGIRRDRLPKDLVIISDRKLADIGDIAKLQMIGLIGDIVTVHAIIGPDSIANLANANRKTGILLISELSTANNLITPEYTERVYTMAENIDTNSAGNIVGFISQKKHRDVAGMVFITPGVNLSKDGAADQRYRSVEDALIRDDNDFVIVGRGILDTVSDEGLGHAEILRQIDDNAVNYQVASRCKRFNLEKF